jgi:hypothetical protein
MALLYILAFLLAAACGQPPTEAPTAAPTTASPTTASPTTASPTTASPTTASPTTASPTTASPITASPTTASPTTAAPGTEAPTEAPTGTAAPTTAAPGTEAPTEAPTGTAAPTTAAPGTAAPTTAAPGTAAPTNAPVGPTNAPTESPTGAPTNAPVAKVPQTEANQQSRGLYYDCKSNPKSYVTAISAAVVLTQPGCICTKISCSYTNSSKTQATKISVSWKCAPGTKRNTEVKPATITACNNAAASGIASQANTNLATNVYSSGDFAITGFGQLVYAGVGYNTGSSASTLFGGLFMSFVALLFAIF